MPCYTFFIGFESGPKNPKAEIRALVASERAPEILQFFEQIPYSEQKFDFGAHVGADLVDAGNIETAIKLAKVMEQSEEYGHFALGLIEYIGYDTYYSSEE